jgi:hypothetical protein
MTENKRIDVESIRPKLNDVLARYGLPPQTLLLVESVQGTSFDRR